MDQVKHLLMGLGADWVLWLLGLLSVLSAMVALERWLYFRSVSGDLSGLADLVDRHLSARDFDAAVAALQQSGSVAAAIASAGLRLADRGTAAVREAMQSRSALERARLKRRLLVLGTIGNNAPFVGLFGTVVGVIHAFDALSQPASNLARTMAAGAAQIASNTVMHSIAEALVATAVGIAVALPAVALYNYLHRRMSQILEDSDVLAHLVLAYLDERRKEG